MDWNPNSDIPIEVPKVLQEFEELDPDRLKAMTKQELTDRLLDGSNAAASLYKDKFSNGNYEQCVLVVSALLKKVGSDVGNAVGEVLLAESQERAKESCRLFFPENEDDLYRT